MTNNVAKISDWKGKIEFLKRSQKNRIEKYSETFWKLLA